MNLYERYHSNRKIQKRIINEDDFTYRSVLNLIKRYSIGVRSVLDIGCGVGTIDLYLGSINKKVLGIDSSENAISIARQNSRQLGVEKNVEFKKYNFPSQSPGGRYDLIIISEVLEHIKNDRLAVKKICKLLNKNGMVIASSPSLNAPLYRLGYLEKFDKDVGHLRRYSVDTFKKLFNDSGLDIIFLQKTEGILRNFLFTTSIGGQILRVLNKKPFSYFVSILDDLLIKFFGESDIYIVATK